MFYGRYVRRLSKRTQRALGELTKVSEERLGNVRTAQSFNGEIQEVHRYNKKIRDLFELGKKEVFLRPIGRVLTVGSRKCILLQWLRSRGEHYRIDGPCCWRTNGLLRIDYDWPA